MRAILRSALALPVALGVPVAGVAAAQPDGDRAGWYLAPMYASIRFDDSRVATAAGGYALAMGHRWRWIGLEVRGEYVDGLVFTDRYLVPGPGPGDPPEERREDGEASLSAGQLALFVQPLRLLGPLDRLAFLEHAFVTLGAGIVKFQNTGTRRADEKNFPYEAGLGYVYPLNFWGLGVALRAEATYRLDPDPQEPASEPDPQARYEDVVFRAGIQVPLSPTAPPPVEPIRVVPPAYADADADGVVDAWDRCADTPQGSLVDKRGCVPAVGPEARP